MNFFTNSRWYYLTSYQNLSKLNVIFMVRKIGQLLLNGGRGGQPPSTLPLPNFGAKTVGSIRKIFLDRCPKDEPTAKNLVCNKSSSNSRENVKKSFFLGGGGASTPFGHRRVNISKNPSVTICSICCRLLDSVQNFENRNSTFKK